MTEAIRIPGQPLPSLGEVGTVSLLKGPVRSTGLYGAAIFLGAFLLFQIQPVLAKIILPWFGGSAAVWSTCLAFFQIVLVLGYLYASWLWRHLRLKRQVGVHLTLLVFSLLLLPVIPDPSWKLSSRGEPTVQILGLLAVTVGLPYFLLSTTGPLLQAWYAGTRPGTQPYRLFALSNAGSMLALITYPIFIEPVFGSRHQALGWSAAYLVFALLTGGITLSLRHSGEQHQGKEPLRSTEVAPDRLLRLMWLALPACASILLLGVTSHLSQDVAPVPFLWLFPFVLYLLSFVLCFESDRWYPRRIWVPLVILALGTLAYGLFGFYVEPSPPVTIAVTGAAFFICCMFCHGELARLKPHPEHLTVFYLMCAGGGAIGGIFVGLLAPRIFNLYLELPLGLLLCGGLVFQVLTGDPSSRLYYKGGHPAYLILMALAVSLAWYLGTGVRNLTADTRQTVRNFYGVLQIFDEKIEGVGFVRNLLHGQIYHGSQILDLKRRHEPIAYYGPNSGLGRLLRNSEGKPARRIGVMGLGAGTLVAFGRKGDYFRIYEINPLIIKLAKTEFTFLSDTEATFEIVEGDARLSLEREPGQQFDVLAMDAFSGDSIPVHLVTKEAFEIYFRHLRPEGVLAVNISNKYLDLVPVMSQAAVVLGKDFLLIDDFGNDQTIYSSTWVLLSNRNGPLSQPELQKAARAIPSQKSKPRLWTDDYSNLWQVLKKKKK